MEFEASTWITEGVRLAGTLHAGVPVACDGWWRPCTELDHATVVERSEQSCRLVRQYPNRRLAMPLGVVGGDGGVVTLVGRARGPSLRDIAGVDEPIARRIVVILLELLETWHPYRDPKSSVYIGPDTLNAATVFVGNDSSVALSNVGNLVGVRPHHPGRDAIGAIGLIFHELIMGEETGFEFAMELGATRSVEAYTAVLEEACSVLAEASSPHAASLLAGLLEPDTLTRRSIPALLGESSDRAAKPGALKAFAPGPGTPAAPPPGPPHPWSGEKVAVRRTLIMDADPTDDGTDRTRAPTSPGADSTQVPSVPGIDHTQPVEMRSGLPAEERFELERRIATGGMGFIYIARDAALRRKIALKVLRKEAAQTPTLVERFVREVQITAQLSHPNVVPVHTAEHTRSGVPAFSMKLIDGDTFSAYMMQCRQQESNGEVDEAHRREARLQHILKVCDAIAYSHSKGVIHRDLKPSNLMLGAFNDVYVMDWGIAKVAGEYEDLESLPDLSDETNSTRIGEAIGTLRYMSPEQAMGENDTLTGASDQFTLGMILFEMVTLERCRPKLDSRAMLRAARKGWTMPDVDPPLSKGLTAIIQRATEREPGDRYPDVTAFAADIRRFLQRRELQVMPDGPLGKLWRRLSAHPVAILATLLALVAAVGLVSVYSLQNSLTASERSAERLQAMTHLTTSVLRRSRTVDARLRSYEQLLEGLAVATVRMMEDGETGQESFAEKLTLDVPGAVFSKRYDQIIDFGRPTKALAPTGDLALARDQERKLIPISSYMRKAVLRSHREDAARWPDDRAETFLHNPGAPLLWVLAGFESGLFLGYPGYEKVAEGYDPRKRPWYRVAEATGHTTWGDPHPDSAGTGVLLAASTPMFDDAGRFLGVAGVELSLDSVIDDLLNLGIPDIKGSYLLNASYKVVVDSAERGRTMAADLHGNQPIEPQLFDSEPLLTRLRDGESSGYVVDGDDLLVFDDTKTLGWFYVVRVDKRRYIGP